MSLDLIMATINSDIELLGNLLDPFNQQNSTINTHLPKDLNYQDPLYGNTALHYAVKMGNFEIIQMLLLYGANRNIRNLKGIFPMNEIEDKFLSNIMYSK
jgi:hypothetical protein